ncbi:hypothetical protein [Terasakiella sp. SH-1]|uniref:hypothetical protein n=1 Tax=Terasakiella sp. SH-1 TaxID=2560057 RepID=UPI00107389A0|nr:hypothetical protein [Terasakiella sp. SH-1]
MTLILIKIFVTVSIVLGLSFVAERISPRWAGLLGGYPLGTAIVLIFITYQEGEIFGAQSAVHTIAGLTANLAVFVAYGLTLTLRPQASFLLPSLSAIAAFFAVGLPLSLIDFSLWTATGFLLVIITLCLFGFKKFEEIKIKNAVRLGLWVTGVRAATACFVVLSITGLAHIMGPKMAGVMASFPSTVFPMIVIMHFTYGRGPVLTIIKHFPKGLGAMICFALSYALYLEETGLLWGTLFAFGIATLYLLAYSILQQKIRPTEL